MEIDKEQTAAATTGTDDILEIQDRYEKEKEAELEKKKAEQEKRMEKARNNKEMIAEKKRKKEKQAEMRKRQKTHQNLTRALPVDRQIVDRVAITTVPRYKTSWASGDEWRFSAQVKFYYKDQEVKEGWFSDVAQAIHHLKHTYDKYAWQEDNYDSRESLCDQEGCSLPWTKTFQIKTRYCAGCGQTKENLLNTVNIRRFCDKHCTRGNCFLEDCDENYLEI